MGAHAFTAFGAPVWHCLLGLATLDAPAYSALQPLMPEVSASLSRFLPMNTWFGRCSRPLAFQASASCRHEHHLASTVIMARHSAALMTECFLNPRLRGGLWSSLTRCEAEAFGLGADFTILMTTFSPSAQPASLGPNSTCSCTPWKTNFLSLKV